MQLRPAAVAGRFYPGDAASLRAAVERLAPESAVASRGLAVLAPHAGWVYSGAVAAETYARVVVPKHVVVLCPNHTGLGSSRALFAGDGFQIPGAVVPVARRLARVLGDECGLDQDERAHLREHAIEVQLPLLLARQPALEIVPIVLGRASLDDCLELGRNMARALDAFGSPTLVVASTDMSHYLPAERARHLDAIALDRVLALDPEGLYRVVVEHEISMCGFIPATVALTTAVARGAKSARLVRYANSGDVSGDYDAVVGYAGVVVS
ncbi:MAG: AmmeMemoRadiSam system protein B [Polyangiaceae bacterium]